MTAMLNSEPDEVRITVVAPVECAVKIAPSTINLRSNGLHILASIRFPEGVTRAEAESNEPLVIYPGGIPATRRWTAGGGANPVGIFAFFDKDALCDVVHNGPAELTVAGKLSSGQWFYGRDAVEVIGNKKTK